MAKILVLAPSGFGKTTSLGPNPEFGIKGLDVKDTFIISVVSKPLTFRGSKKLYPLTTADNLRNGRRIISTDANVIAQTMTFLANSPLKNIVWDDANYVMQDYYMKNALRTGWDAPKKIGQDMSRIFDAMELYSDEDRHIIVLAHGEDVTKPDGRIYTKMKTTGKMVDEYVTPEGKFDVVLVGKSKYDQQEKKVIKQFVTNEDETYTSPKSPSGMFKDLYILNDLGLVIDSVTKYYNDEEPVESRSSTIQTIVEPGTQTAGEAADNNETAN